MIAVDTNILVYAHRKDASFHELADQKLSELSEGDRIWAIPWACLHEFFAIVTHPKIYKMPTPITDAVIQVECWLECPRLQMIGESDGHWQILKSLALQGKIAGPLIHDARIAAICLQHAVTTLWSADRDFSRIHNLKVINPLLTNAH